MKIIRVDSMTGTPLRASLMTDSAIRPDRRPLFLPDGDWMCEIRPAVRIDRLGKAISAEFAGRYYDNFALVNYLRPADESNDIRLDMMDDAIVAGGWTSLENMPCAAEIDTEALDSLIEYLSKNVTFKTGDIIILPYITETYKPFINQHIKVQELLEFTIK